MVEPVAEALDVAALLDRLERVRRAVEKADAGTIVDAVQPRFRESARNLARYVTLRQSDLRDLQRGLAGLGLSSLGRSEADVLGTLEQVECALRALVAAGVTSPHTPAGRPLLEAHADALFGPAPPGRRVRIMLTAGAELAHDADRVRALVAAGTDVVRINCAHDGPDTWRAIARNVRTASAVTGRPCAILADLAGPKLRTGALAPGPAVVDWHVRRDEVGRVTEPTRVWLGRRDAAPGRVDVALPLAGPLRHRILRPGDALRFTDVRGRRRTLRAETVGPDGVLLLADRAAWVASGTRLRRVRGRRLGPEVAVVGELPARLVPLRIHEGDHLRVTGEDEPGGIDVGGAHIPVTMPEALAAMRPGNPIYFDDGRIAGRIVSVGPRRAEVVVTRTLPGGVALRADKGVNLPASELPLTALTVTDLESLDVVVGEVDLVGLSFVRSPGDVTVLRRALAERGRPDLGILLKIETQAGFEALPDILLEAMRGERVGVMIARGDLAVECGFERLAEVQEEILWICEAAHVPVVWATQVLDTLARTGVTTRAEITDAAAGQRAECVMLNKGPHAELAVATLDDILRRMAAHQEKKTAMLRRLHSLLPHGHPLD